MYESGLGIIDDRLCCAEHSPSGETSGRQKHACVDDEMPVPIDHLPISAL